MRKSNVAAVAVVLAWAVSTVVAHGQEDALGSPQSASLDNQSFVGAHFSEKREGKRCVDDFKTRMNDPASFQLAGPFRYSSGVTEIMLPMIGRMAGATSLWGLPPIPASPEIKYIAVGVPIRGSNPFGGVVLQKLQCIYIRSSANLIYIGSGILPDDISD